MTNPAGRLSNDLGILPNDLPEIPNDLPEMPNDLGRMANDLPFLIKTRVFGEKQAFQQGGALNTRRWDSRTTIGGLLTATATTPVGLGLELFGYWNRTR